MTQVLLFYQELRKNSLRKDKKKKKKTLLSKMGRNAVCIIIIPIHNSWILGVLYLNMIRQTQKAVGNGPTRCHNAWVNVGHIHVDSILD